MLFGSSVPLPLALCPFLSTPAHACITPLAPAGSKGKNEGSNPHQAPQTSPTPQKSDGAAWDSHKLQRPAGPHAAHRTALCAEKQDHRERERIPVWTDSGSPVRST